MISVHLQGKSFNITVIQFYAPATDTEEAEVDWFNKDLQNLLESESHSVMSNSLQPHGLYSPWNSLSQNTGVGSFSLLQGIFPTDWTQGSCIAGAAEPQGKPKNTGVGSLSLLQRIFPIQESNQGLLPCRWTLCQLSYQESTTLSRTNTQKRYSLHHRGLECKSRKSRDTWNSGQFVLGVQNELVKRTCWL